MPLYEYQCEACAHRFERIRKFADPPVEACPSCGGVVRKLVSSPAFQFKGSGWYVTDYARSGKTDKADSGGSKGDGAGSSDKGTSTDAGQASDRDSSDKKEKGAGAEKSTSTDKADKPASQSSKA